MSPKSQQEVEEMFDPDIINEQVEEAPISGTNFVNFGKLTTTVEYRSWSDAENTYVRRTPARGERLNKEAGEVMEFNFAVDIAELNPKIEFTYERNQIAVLNSGKNLTNWGEVVKPSLIEAFGADWARAIFKHPYVAVQDVTDVNGKTSKKSGKVLSTIKFLASYPDKAACVAARDAKYTKSATPAANGAIPAKVIEQARSMFEGVGKNEGTFMQLLEQHPYGDQYEPEAVAEAVRQSMA